jgi:glycosyltransferase involved in cell wall biosynthesis
LILVGRCESNLDPLKQETLNTIDALLAIESVDSQYGDDLLAYYAASDCFVFPSYREGFPNTVLEAGAMGLPSIVTDINGSREIIEHGKNGVIIPSKDVNALYQAMEQMFLDKQDTMAMAENSRAMIAERFEQSFVQKCLYEFYDEIMK